MSDQVLTILKFFLIALIWLFFLRVLRAVWVEIRSGEVAAAPPSPAPSPTAAPAPAAPPPKAAGRSRRTPSTLTVIEPADLAGRQFPADDGVRIGRAPDSDICIDGDSYVSSRHARLVLRDGRLWVEDLGSTNGTYVNSAPVTAPTALRKGDRLQIGRTVLEAEG